MKKYLDAGYTLEAALVMPILFLVIAYILKTGFGLGNETQTEANSLSDTIDLSQRIADCVTWIRTMGTVKEIIN